MSDDTKSQEPTVNGQQSDGSGSEPADPEAVDTTKGEDESRSPVAEERRRVHDLWVAGTEEPQWVATATDEGAQELLPPDLDPALAAQRGVAVVDDYVEEPRFDEEERQTLNMGPQHPATHGVLRIQLELEGETIRRAKPIIGYLHTGMEKTGETLTFMQGGTNVTRMDYLSPFHNELCFALATEQLLDVDIPERAEAIRILMTELNRVASHLIWLATFGLDIGALSMMLYGWREREVILEFFEKVTGLRMNHNYIRVGGVAADLPEGWESDVEHITEVVRSGLADYETLLNQNPIFIERTQGVGVITPAETHAYGVTGANARAAGVDYDVRKVFPYSGIEQYEFDVPVGKHGDAFDRYIVRMEEMRQSLRIAEQVVETMPPGDYRSADPKVTPPPRERIDESMEALIHHFKIFTSGFEVPAGEVYQAVESPRGELGMYLVSNGGTKPWRLHARTPSFATVQALPVMMTDLLVADVIATLASLDPVLGDVDR
jgi:NADH-quinone oxidoreductase subunit D